MSDATATDAALRDQIADAVQPLLMDTLPKVIAAARAQEAADAVMPVVAAALTAARASCCEDGERTYAEMERHFTEQLTAARDETARQRQRAEQAERERDEAIAALTRHAAEAHRRKWAHDGDNQAAFDALHRIGNEILASRDRLLAALDRPADPPAKENP